MILALDQGTTSSRAMVFDHGGHIRAVAQREFRQFYPQSGWVEHDPREIWETQLAVAREALNQANLTARDIAALGITNQRETTIIWDRATGQPIHSAIVWQDRRTAAMCEELKAAGHENTVRGKTGLLLNPYFCATKIRWILDHVPGAHHRAERGELAFGTVDSWLVWHLTGGRLHVTDTANASRTLLFNIRTGVWDNDLLKVFDIPRAILPEVRSCSEIHGETDAKLLGGAIPITGMAGDQQAALFGQGCFSPGLAKNTYGTGCFMLMNLGEQPILSAHRLLTTTAWKIAGKTTYALEGSVFIGGAVVQWLRDGLGLIKTAAEIETLAGSMEDNGGVYLVPAFVGLGAPHWDPHARGLIIGLSRGTTAGHIARAALEGIAHQVADVLEVMRQDSAAPVTELRVDGGAAANDLLMQCQADLLGIPIVRPKVTESTALGAAYLAGLAVGFWKDTEEIKSHREVDRRFEPRVAADRVARERERWREAVKRTRGWEPS